MLLDSNVRNCQVQNLEIQVDFLCEQCRALIEKLATIKAFSALHQLKIIIVNFDDTTTVGLYVHYLKFIFKNPSLKYFELGSIPDFIFSELKLWFLPDNIYFSQIRSFTMFTRNDNPNSLLFRFNDQPIPAS